MPAERSGGQTRLHITEAAASPRREMPAYEPTSIYTREVPQDPGMPFPSIVLRDDKGQATATPPGEVLYAFFKTTCPTCELAWPYLDRVWKIAEGGRLAVLAVSQDDPETTARFYDDLGVAVPTLYDRDPWKASEAVGLTNVPAFFVVGKDGVIRDAAVGFQRHKMEEFAALAANRAGRRAAALFSPSESVPAMKPG